MDKILIATVLKPQGLKGELKCKLENENFSMLKNVNEIYLNDKSIPTRVLNKRFTGGYLYLTLSTINCREKADLIRNAKIFANFNDIIIPKDEYIISDLIDCNVLGDNGQQIGKLIDVQNYGAGDILVIEQYKREYMVPFIKALLVKVDLTNKKIYFNKELYDEVKICD